MYSILIIFVSNKEKFIRRINIMSDLPLATVKRLINRTSDDRVSAAAVEKLAEIGEDYMKIIAEHASKLAHHSGRTTIKAEDIKLAVDTL